MSKPRSEVVVPRATRARSDPPLERGTSAPGLTGPERALPHAPILVVDDHPTNLKLVRVLLAAEGYEVAGAGTAEEALLILGEVRPALILLDLQLPGMDGFDLTRRLKRDPRTRAIPIVAITAYAMNGDEQKALAAGCDGYLTKPIDTRALPGIVAGLLRKTSETTETGGKPTSAAGACPAAR